MQPDGGYLLEAPQFRGFEASVPGKKRRSLIDDHRHGEAKGVNAPSDLFDLFFRMRTRVARVGLDSAKGDKFDLVHENLHCGQDEGAMSPLGSGNQICEELRLGSRRARTRCASSCILASPLAIEDV